MQECVRYFITFLGNKITIDLVKYNLIIHIGKSIFIFIPFLVNKITFFVSIREFILTACSLTYKVYTNMFIKQVY